MSANNGGPAFPRDGRDLQRGTVMSQEGMSLRDYFAAAALQGGIAAPGFGKESNMKSIAEQAYMLADAMLEARSK